MSGSVEQPMADPDRGEVRSPRDRLLAATLELLAREGPQVPVDEIVQLAGVAKGTLYYHFGSKEALYQAALEDELQRIQTLMEGSDASPEENLHGALQGLARWIGERPDRLRALLLPWQPGSGLGPSVSQALQHRMVKQLTQVLIVAQAARLIDPSWPVDLLAVAVYGALGHVVEHLKLQGEKPNPQDIAEALFSFLMRRPTEQPS